MAKREFSDEYYILDLCDEILGLKASRQHRFDFLRGDPGKRGIGVRLPVDAYYPSLNLVIEYRERQHTEPVPVFDQHQTVSGVSRGEQRRLYDERRRRVIPQRGITLVELSYLDFEHAGSKKLLSRNRELDEQVIRRRLRAFLGEKKT